MKKFLKISLVFIIVLGIQVAGSLLLIYPYIVSWGATNSEVTAPMIGDKYAEQISATRAIDIHSPQPHVWACLVNLGADRKGFYSFTMLESLYGCEIANKTDTASLELNAGRLMPTTSPDANGNYKEGFVVLEVEQRHSFALKDWGTFEVNKIDDNNSRLIVRTNTKAPHNLVEKVGFQIFEMLHYVMERRMMLGIKDNAETNGQGITSMSDWTWILCIFVSGIAGLVMISSFSGYYRLFIPTVLFILWQLVFFVLNPKPLYGVSLVVMVCVLFFLYHILSRNNVQKLNISTISNDKGRK